MRARLMAILEAGVRERRARIVAGLAAVGVAAVLEGEDVRASAPGLAGRWARDLTLREAERNGA